MVLRVKVTYQHRDAGSFTVTDGEPDYEGVPQRFRSRLEAAIDAVPMEIEVASHAFWPGESPRGPVLKYPSDEWWREVCREDRHAPPNPDYRLRVLGDSDSEEVTTLV